MSRLLIYTLCLLILPISIFAFVGDDGGQGVRGVRTIMSFENGSSMILNNDFTGESDNYLGKLWNRLYRTSPIIPISITPPSPSTGGGGGGGGLTDWMDYETGVISDYCPPNYIEVYNPTTFEAYCWNIDMLDKIPDDVKIIGDLSIDERLEFLTKEEELEMGIWNYLDVDWIVNPLANLWNNLFEGNPTELVIVEEQKIKHEWPELYGKSLLFWILIIIGAIFGIFVLYYFGGYIWGLVGYILSIIISIIAMPWILFIILLIGLIIFLAAKGVLAL